MADGSERAADSLRRVCATLLTRQLFGLGAMIGVVRCKLAGFSVFPKSLLAATQPAGPFGSPVP